MGRTVEDTFKVFSRNLVFNFLRILYYFSIVTAHFVVSKFELLVWPYVQISMNFLITSAFQSILCKKLIYLTTSFAFCPS